MDSMRNLRGSLPRSSSQAQQPTSQADLLQTFRQAALSVTNLYKRSIEEAAIERRAGYQDAIYDLLSLLDKENLGLGDGEGWRIRQWATEKQQSGHEPDPESEGDDNEAEDRERSPGQAEDQPVVSSPVRESERTDGRLVSPTDASSPPVMPIHAPQPPQASFTFQTTHAYPTNRAESPNPPAQQAQTNSSSHARHAPGSRANRRSAHGNQRQGHRSSKALGAGAGSKRKIDLDNIWGNIGGCKDVFGGNNPKRPRPL